MKTSQNVLYRASYGSITNLHEKAAPDSYISSCDDVVKCPSNNFIIARDTEGKVVSEYGDLIWNLTAYRMLGDTSTATINYSKLSESNINDAKWIVFVLMFLVDSGKATALSTSTIICYMKPIRLLEKYSVANDIGMFDVLCIEGHLLAFVRSLKTRSSLKGFVSLVYHLHSIGSNRTGIKIFDATQLSIIKEKSSQLGKDEQHPVIPPRIYSELVKQVTDFVNNTNSYKLNLINFLNEILKSEQFARSSSQQHAIGFKTSEYEPFFEDAANAFKLDGLFERYNIHTLPNLNLFFTRILHACRLMVYIYSGMRNSEALSLNIGCLKEEVYKGRKVFRIHGETSKLIGQRKTVSWITSENVKNAVDLAKEISQVIGRYIGLNKNETPLFISTGYLGFTVLLELKKSGVIVSRSGSKRQEVFPYLDVDKFKIDQNDFEHLEKINAFRAWGAENSFQVGKIWRFTAHQFRRSLSFYVSQSGLVSLPSLKRQLKHISREMTIYYSQATEGSDAYNHDVSKFIRKIKHEADASAYLSDVLDSEEPLWGAHGRYIDKHNKSEESLKIFKQDRSKLVKMFRKGELAYKVTPLGACTTIAPCDKKAMREMAACISCDKAIIKSTKLDRVMDQQKLFVDELKNINPDSLEYRTELAELEALVGFKKKVILKDKK